MRQLLWAVVVGTIVAVAYLCWRTYRNWQDKQRAEEERFSALMAETMRAARPPAPALGLEAEAARALAQAKLLIEAAGKAAEAGEHALSLQLYTRLLERYPVSALAAEARTGMEEQQRMLARLL